MAADLPAAERPIIHAAWEQTMTRCRTLARRRQLWAASVATLLAAGALPTAVADQPGAPAAPYGTARESWTTPATAAPTARAGSAAVMQQYARQSQQSACIAVLGAVGTPGAYQFSATTVALPDLLAQCGGLTNAATGTLRLVRDGRPGIAFFYGPTASGIALQAGDVLVVDARGTRQHGVGAVPHDQRTHAAPGTLQLALLGVAAEPVVVNILAEHAKVGTILKFLNQQQIPPGGVSVIAGGSRLLPGESADPLSDAAILVFDPRAVTPETLGDLPAAHRVEPGVLPAATQPGLPPAPLPAADGGRALQTTALPAGMPALPAGMPAAAVALNTRRGDAVQAVAAGNSGTILTAAGSVPAASEAMLDDSAADLGPPADPAMLTPLRTGATSPVPPPTFDADLTALPRVEMLAPPPGEGGAYPRTADMSGRVPIGGGGYQSHIVPLPTDALYGPAPTAAPIASQTPTVIQPPSVAPAPPVPSAESLAPVSNDGGLSLDGLALTILLGGGLGVASFWLLRRIKPLGLRRRLERKVHIAIARQRAASRAAAASIATEGPTAHADDAPLAHGHSGRPAPIREAVVTPPVAAKTQPTISEPASEALAALIAGRMAFREEPLTLPATLRVHGHSPALKKRRIDPPAAEVAKPHFPVVPAAARTATAAPVQVEPREAVAAEPRAAHAATHRIDPGRRPSAAPAPTAGAQPAPAPHGAFGRALAARRQAAARPA